jgi:hypothetical protein
MKSDETNMKRVQKACRLFFSKDPKFARALINWHVIRNHAAKRSLITKLRFQRPIHLMFSLLRAKKLLMGKAATSATETGSILDAAFSTPPTLPSFPPETPIAAMPPPPSDAELDAAWGEGAFDATLRLP